jgi:hypothetical protein
MPSYQNVTPPISLMPGDVGFSFNNEAFPGSATAGSQFAIPSYAGQPDSDTAVRWQTIFGTAPTAVKYNATGSNGRRRRRVPDHRHDYGDCRRSPHCHWRAGQIPAHQVQ